jgi:hypothetical protein
MYALALRDRPGTSSQEGRTARDVARETNKAMPRRCSAMAGWAREGDAASPGVPRPTSAKS